jgi:hypothetical protein
MNDPAEAPEAPRHPPMYIAFFRCPIGKVREAEIARAALASYLPPEEQAQFVAIPVRTHAGLSGWRLQAVAPDDSVNFICNIKTLEIRWVDYAPVNDG